MYYPDKTIPESYTPYEEYSDEATPLFPDDSNTVDSDGTAAFEKSITDNPIQAEANLPQGKKIKLLKLLDAQKNLMAALL